LPPMPKDHKTDTYLVKGCQSKVWVYPNYTDGKVWLEVDSNTDITKGLIFLLREMWNGKTPSEILDTELFFLDKIGMNRMIGSQRSNGLLSMIKQIKMYALAYQVKQN